MEDLEIDSWESIQRNLSKVLDDDTLQPANYPKVYDSLAKNLLNYHDEDDEKTTDSAIERSPMGSTTTMSSIHPDTYPQFSDDGVFFDDDQFLVGDGSETETLQIDHLMHLLSTRLCVLEDSSASIDKKMDTCEMHVRKKLEDCRQKLKEKIDEFIDSFDKDVSNEVQARKRNLQKLERRNEEHLAATNKLLTQAKLKLSRMKITTDELRTLHDRILDSLVKTKKLQRETSEFECLFDFIPQDILEDRSSIGTLRFKEDSSNASLINDKNVTGLNPYAEKWEPKKSCEEELELSSVCLATIPPHRRSSWNPVHEKQLMLQVRNSEDYRSRRSTWATCIQSKQLLVPCKNCIQLIPSRQTSVFTLPDEIRFYQKRNSTHFSSLLTLDMQRPIVVDCYGDPPRHLKCIKGLTFMGASKLLICENGRKAGHKNVLLFSVTGCFLSYVPGGAPFTNPTTLCLLRSDEVTDIVVVDDDYIKLISTDTLQLRSKFSLDDYPTLEEKDAFFQRQDRFGGVHAYENNIYVCDRKQSVIKIFDVRTPKKIAEWNQKCFMNPNFIYRKNDSVYVSDSGNNSVMIFTPDGQHIGDLKAAYGTNAKNLFNNPCGICDDGENIAVADLYNNRVQLFSRDCLIGSIYSPCIESPFSIAYHSMGCMAISNGRPRTVTLYFSTVE